MVKTAKKLVNFRLPLEVVFWVQEAAELENCSQSDVVERAILLLQGNAPDVIVASASPVDAANIPGVSVGMPPKKPVVIKRYKCDHCGTSPAVPRVGDICETCQESGHRNGVRECPECWSPA